MRRAEFERLDRALALWLAIEVGMVIATSLVLVAGAVTYALAAAVGHDTWPGVVVLLIGTAMVLGDLPITMRWAQLQRAMDDHNAARLRGGGR